MSSNMFLVLDLNGNETFDPDKVRECLKDLNGIHDWRDNTADALFECQFDFAEDSTILLLPRGLESISIWGVGDASLKLALEIQACYDVEIHALNDSFTMDIVLSSLTSLDDFKKAIRAQTSPGS